MIWPKKLITDRLVLKEHTLDEEYVQLWVRRINQNLEWLNTFLPHFTDPLTFEKEYDYLKMLICGHQEQQYAIFHKRTNALIGSIGAYNFQKDMAECSLMIFKNKAGHHYGPEALSALEQLLYQQGIRHLLLKISVKNLRSLKMAKKLGYLGKNNDKSPFVKMIKTLS